MTEKPLFIIGLDAMDKDLVFEWCQEGDLPNLSRLKDTSIRGEIQNPLGLEAGACWPSFYCGRSPAATGQYDGARYFNPQTYQDENYNAGANRCEPVWKTLASSGMKCILVDAPYALVKQDDNCMYIVDRAAHVPAEGGDIMKFRTSPPELVDRIEKKYGEDPASGHTSDHFSLKSAEDVNNFKRMYTSRIKKKTDMVIDLARETDWSYFLAVFTEAHCVGHRCWHIHDPKHPWHNEGIARTTGDPIRAVYQALDEAVGRIWSAVGDDARLIAYLSHGMGPRHSGTRLLDRILTRLDGGSLHTRTDPVNTVARRLWRKSPTAFRNRLAPIRKRVTNDGFQLGRKRRKFFEVIANDRTAGVRLNVLGREANGTILSGAEYDRYCEMLTRDLLEVINAETGEPLVAEVIKTHDHYDGEFVERLPDILVTWNRSAPINAATSDKIGSVDNQGIFTTRSGDHNPVGYFFATGQGWEPLNLNKIVSVLDFAPTVATLLGLEKTVGDGQPIDVLLGKAVDS